MNYKKISTMALAVLAFCSLSACASTPTTTEPSTATSSQVNSTISPTTSVIPVVAPLEDSTSSEASSQPDSVSSATTSSEEGEEGTVSATQEDNTEPSTQDEATSSEPTAQEDSTDTETTPQDEDTSSEATQQEDSSEPTTQDEDTSSEASTPDSVSSATTSNETQSSNNSQGNSADPIMVEGNSPYEEGKVTLIYLAENGDNEIVDILTEEDKTTVKAHLENMQSSRYSDTTIPSDSDYTIIGVEVHRNNLIEQYIFTNLVIDDDYMGKYISKDAYAWTIIEEEAFEYFSSFF